ncbi:hypothetical protein F66182_7318, partial [Fusarium sp. NRRL 66182]
MGEFPSLEVHSRVAQKDATTFTANLTESFSVGTVPNGGFITAIFLRAANAYLASRNQPDTFAAHWQFLNAAYVGPVVLIVEEVRRGRGLSVVHITLYQEGLTSQSPWISANSKKKAAAYITNTSLETERGLTLATGFELSAPPPPADLTKLAVDEDPNWERLFMVFMGAVPMSQYLEFHVPKSNNQNPASLDIWL